jgi:hypothetical protein
MESVFLLDRSIIGLVYKKKICEKMNKLGSKRPWLIVLDILDEQVQSLLFNFLCIKLNKINYFLRIG